MWYSPRVKSRWAIVVLALLAASAFAVSVQAGRWWSMDAGGVEIGPFGSRNCFGGACRPTSLTWVGGSERWARMGVAAWAAGLLCMLVLLGIAAAVAAKRNPRLLAQMGLVSIATAVAAGIGFIALFPGMEGAGFDRGVWLYVGAVVLGTVAAVGVLRRARAAPAQT